MRIDSPIMTNAVATGSFTGSFSGIHYGDGSNLTGVTSYTDSDTLAYINTLNVLSGSDGYTTDAELNASSSALILGYTNADSSLSSSLAADIATNSSGLSSHIGDSSNPHSVTAAQVGLGNVTNESKETMFTSPTFTGTPTAPTAAANTNSTQIATTAYVQQELSDLIGGAPAALDTLLEISASFAAGDTNLAGLVDGKLSKSSNLSDLTDASAARTNLGVDAAGTDNSTDVTLVTTSHDYLSIAGQAITLGTIQNNDLANSSITINGTATSLGSSITLDADDIDDTSTTHKFATAAQLSQIATNAAAISNLDNTYTTDAELNASSSALIEAYGNADNSLSSSLATALTNEYIAADSSLSSSLAIDIATNTAKIGVTTETVRTAGALMDDEVDADIKTLSLPASTTISAFGKTLVDDADAATARTTLGVDAAGTDNSTDVTLAGSLDYITISGQQITRNAINVDTDLSITPTSVGKAIFTGSNAAAIRSTIGVDAAGTDNSTDVTLAGAYDYITIVGQTITRNQITNDDLAGSITNAKLSNSSITINGSAVSLGGTRTLVTDDIAEDGSPVNLWYTDARVKTKLNAENVISSSGQVSVASTSGYQEPAIVNNAGTPIFVDGITAAEIRTLVDVDQAGTDNSTDVTIAAGRNYITITGQELTLGVVDISDDTNLTVSDTTGQTGINMSLTGDTISGVVSGLTTTSNVSFASVTTTGNITVGGDLTVLGSRTELQVTNLNVEDKNILIASGAADSAAADGAGITIGGANESITWNHASSRFDFSDDVHVAGNITVTGTVDGVDIAALSTTVGNINTQVPALYDNAGTPTLNTGITAAEVRTAIDVDQAGTDNSTNVTLVTTSHDYLSITGQAITLGTIDISDDTNLAVSDTTGQTGINMSLTGDTISGVVSGLTTSSDVQFDSLGIGTAAPGTTGVIRATNDIIAYYSSDERLKDNISEIPNALEKVESLRGVEFDWNNNQEVHKGHDIGVIAQEVEAVLPELVENRDNGYKAVKYEKLTAVLIQAVKELSARVKELENK